MTTKLTLRQLGEIHHVNFSTLAAWQKAGVNVHDSRAVVAHVRELRTRPPEWRDQLLSIDPAEGGTIESLRKKKLAEETIRIELANAKVRGELVPTRDAERIAEAWAAALQAGLAERRATMPAILAGLDEAAIADRVAEMDHELLTQLGDLESALWDEVLRQAGAEVQAETAPPPKRRSR